MIPQHPAQSNTPSPSPAELPTARPPRKRATELQRLLNTRTYRYTYGRARRVARYRRMTAELLAWSDRNGERQAAITLQRIYNRLCSIEDRMRANQPPPAPPRPWTV